MIQLVIAATPDAPGMGYAVNAWSIIGKIMNCQPAISIKKPKAPMTGQSVIS